jgi:hypothetical protein
LPFRFGKLWTNLNRPLILRGGVKLKKSKSVLRTNVIYGLIGLVPAAIIFLLLTKIVEILEKMAVPLNLESNTSVVVAIMLGLLLWKRFIFPIFGYPVS